MDKRKSKIPKIRFPEFTDEWEHKQLSELLQVSKKKNKDLKYSKEEVLSVSGEEGIVNQIEHMGRSYAGASVHNYGVVENGDIVYTKSPLKANPYGIIKMNKGLPGIVSTLYAIYKVNKQEADGEFIEHYFSLDANTNRYLRPLVRKGAKNDMKINNEYVLYDRIFTPVKKEQEQISKFLNLLDIKTKKIKEKKRLIQIYKRAVLQNIFSQKIRFRNDNGSQFSDWQPTKLSKVFKIFNGFAFSSKDSCEEGIRWIKIADVGIQKMKTENESFLPLGFEKKHKKFILHKGDFVIALTRPILNGDLKISMIDDYSDGSLLNQRVGKIESKNNKIFVYYFLQQQWLINAIEKNIAGTDPPNLSPKEIDHIRVSVPELKEQKKIAEFLKGIDRRLESAESQLKVINDYKKSLLQQMLCY